MLCMPPELQLNVSLRKDDRGEVHYIVGVFFLNKLKTQEWLFGVCLSVCLVFSFWVLWGYFVLNEVKWKENLFMTKGVTVPIPPPKPTSCIRFEDLYLLSVMIKPVYMLLILNMHLTNF